MPLFDVELERVAKVVQVAMITVEAPTEKEACLRAIEDDYAQAQWENLCTVEEGFPEVASVERID